MHKTFFFLDDEETTSATPKTDYEATTKTMAIGPVKKKDNSWWNYVFGSSEGIHTHYVFGSQIVLMHIIYKHLFNPKICCFFF